MSSFTIYEGETAVRMKLARAEAENRKLRAENERLRAKCGEAVVAEAIAEVQAQTAHVEAQTIQTAGTEGQKVTIGQLSGPLQMNPLFARARAKAAPPVPVIAQPDDLPASTQEVGQTQAPSQRFSLIELK